MIKYDLLHITIFLVNKDLIDYSKQTILHKIQKVIMIVQIIFIKETGYADTSLISFFLL